MQYTLGEQVEKDRPFPRGPRRLDAQVGGVLGQVQHERAVGEQGRAAFTEIESPRVLFEFYTSTRSGPS